MKVVLLAGGFGTRISEESHLRPKPMIEIGEMPILLHIMKLYSHYGYDDFIICCGYKGHMIKRYFANFYLHNCDVSFDFANSHKLKIHNNSIDPWKITLIDTGKNTMTGGRLKRVQNFIGNETFMLTYGDGVSDLDISELVAFHKENNKIGTLTTVHPEGRFGVIDLDNSNLINDFREKRKSDSAWINGGFMVFEPQIFNYIEDDNTVLERKPLEALAAERQLAAYKHDGFWQCMDTQRDKELLERLWKNGEAPWKK